MKKIRVVVLYGGRSAEREISLVTGQQIIDNLDRKKYTVFPLEIPKKGNTWVSALLAKKPDIVIPALHGSFGEDGTIQGMLEMMGIRYTFSGVLASSLAMDKYRLTQYLLSHGIKSPPGILINNLTISQFSNFKREVGFPCVVKPNRLGSSVGITVNVRTPTELRRALKLAFQYDREVLAEKHIYGREITAAVLGNEKPRALPLIEIVPKIGNFYNYESKYAAGGSEHIIPAPLSPQLTRKIQEIACRAHTLVGARGVSRSDFILRGTTPYFLELNTIPGMTPTSLVPQSAQKAGLAFPKLLDQLIALAQTKVKY